MFKSLRTYSILTLCLSIITAAAFAQNWRFEQNASEGSEEYLKDSNFWRYSEAQDQGDAIFLESEDSEVEWSYKETKGVDPTLIDKRLVFVDPLPIGIKVDRIEPEVKKGLRIPELRDFNHPSFDYEIGHFFSLIKGLDKFNRSDAILVSRNNFLLQLGMTYRFLYNFSASFFWKWKYYQYANGRKGSRDFYNRKIFTSEGGVAFKFQAYDWMYFKIALSYSEDIHYRKREELNLILERIRTPKAEFTIGLDLYKGKLTSIEGYYSYTIHGEGDANFYSARGEDAKEGGLVLKHLTHSGIVGVRGYYRVNDFTNDFFFLNEDDLGLTFFHSVAF